MHHLNHTLLLQYIISTITPTWHYLNNTSPQHHITLTLYDLNITSITTITHRVPQRTHYINITLPPQPIYNITLPQQYITSTSHYLNNTSPQYHHKKYITTTNTCVTSSAKWWWLPQGCFSQLGKAVNSNISCVCWVGLGGCRVGGCGYGCFSPHCVPRTPKLLQMSWDFCKLDALGKVAAFFSASAEVQRFL